MASNAPSAVGQTGHPTHLAPPYPSGITRHMQPMRTASPSQGSVTQTVIRNSRSVTPEPLVLRLRGSHEPTPELEEISTDSSTRTNRRRRIQWAEDVVDNEGLGRKKSKVCCIYHKDRPVGESSSDESSSSDDSDSDGSGNSSGADDGSARPVGGSRRGKRRRRGRKHDHHDHNHEHGAGCGHGKGSGRRPSPNAYEKMPRYDMKPLNGNPSGGDGQGRLKS